MDWAAAAPQEPASPVCEATVPAGRCGAVAARCRDAGSAATAPRTPSDASVCGDTVFVRASARLIGLPVMNGGFLGARRYAYGSLISDMPAAQMNSITSDYNVVRFEFFRSVIRETLRISQETKLASH